MMIYRGQFPNNVDAINSISSGLHYPTSYGYASVGRVTEIGKSVDGEWEN